MSTHTHTSTGASATGATITGRALRRPTGTLIARGAVLGMVAGAAMAMYAMVASATYQHHGFFTPLFHIGATVGSPDAMMRSMTEAMAGNRFWFTAGPAALGLTVHMVTSAMFGIVFVLAAERLRSAAVVPAGMAYGVIVMLAAALVGLPIAAEVFGGGDAISDMPAMVGWATFTVEHVMFGTMLGVLARRGAHTDARHEAHRRSGSATLV